MHPLITHYSDSFDGQKSCKRLADLTVKTCIDDFLDEYIVGLTSDLQLLRSNLAQNTYCQARPGERMAGIPSAIAETKQY